MKTSPLHSAAKAGDLLEIRRLLDAGADIEAVDERSGHTPLMAACLSPRAGVEAMAILLERGAKVDVCTRVPAKEEPEEDEDLVPELSEEMLEGLELDPGMLEVLRAGMNIAKTLPKESDPLIAEAVRHGNLQKIRLLLEHGADASYRSSQGYTLLTHCAHSGGMEMVRLLVDAGAPLDGISDWGESALSVRSRIGKFDEIRQLLEMGADPSPLKWSPLHHAVALGSLDEMKHLLEDGADPEERDGWERTAFLLSIHAGDPAKAAMLLDHGATSNVCGRCGKTPLMFALDRDDPLTLQWLIDLGLDLNQTDEFKNTALMEAAEQGAVACFRLLDAAGADWSLKDHTDQGLVEKASHPEIVNILLERGEDLADLEDEVLRDFIGLGTADELEVSHEDYLNGRFRRFGTSNPERMRVPFWDAMVRCGWGAWKAADSFGDSSFGRGNPVWCHDRFGMSLTRLPDGRFIQVAGEHEDSYDPDFCIYNDVIVHDGSGGFEIFGYPENLFPPTDFHSATLVGSWLYLIGNLGYAKTRAAAGYQTQVFRLHIGTMVIERVEATGDSPGWIHSHTAVLDDGLIRISGGKVIHSTPDGESEIVDLEGNWAFDIAAARWAGPC
jgi:ankyrin repeat protein